MTSRFLTVAFATAIIGAAATPAMAATGSCATTPTQIRTLAATAPSADNARKALQLATVGEQLCEQGARYEAGKKFSAAAKLLGTDVASLNAAPVAR